MKKRIISICLVLVLCIAQLPVNDGVVQAEQTETVNQEETASKEAAYQQYLKERESQDIFSATSGVEATNSMYTNSMENTWLQFVVGDDARFTIGNVEGNKNYSSDDNHKLLYGHPNPWSSFSTIRVETGGKTYDYQYETSNSVYDRDNLTITSTMNVVETDETSSEIFNIDVIQKLEFVSTTDLSNVKDTIKISYQVVNKGTSSVNVGERFMMDTMLASHDDAPFKAPGYGNILSELELNGAQIPQTYQVYDVIDNPTVFATGTLFRSGERKPDKVQFAKWSNIYSSDWNCVVEGDDFGDSAVGIYFNPVAIAAGSSNTVQTYYGVNANFSSEEDAEDATEIQSSSFAVVVYDTDTSENLSGATVNINGKDVTTNENGMAIFDNMTSYEGNNTTIKVSKSGYTASNVTREIVCGSYSGIGIVSIENATNKPNILSVTKDNSIDLLSTLVYYDEAQDSDTATTSNSYTSKIRVSNSGTANTYRLVQEGEVKYESTNGVFEIPIITSRSSGEAYSKPRIKGLDAGKIVDLQCINNALGTTSKALGFRISKPTVASAAGSKGSVSLGDKIKFTIPDSVPFIGGTEGEFGLQDDIPFEIKVDENGKVRVAFNKEASTEWDAFKELNHNALNMAQAGRAFGGTPESFGGGAAELKADLCGYGEGYVDSNGNLNVNVGITVTITTGVSYTQQFFVGWVPVFVKVGVEGELAAQLQGDFVLGDGNFSFTGGQCEMTPKVKAYLEGGVGASGVLSASAEGSLSLYWNHKFSNDYDRVWVDGALTLKAKAFLFKAQKVFKSDELTIYDSNVNITSSELPEAFNVYDESSFTLMERDTTVNSTSLPTIDDGGELTMSTGSSYSDITMVRVNGKNYRFWLEDINTRSDENRTALVYSVENELGWSEYKIIDDDETADFEYKVVVNGNMIYVVWQNCDTIFNAEVTLTDMAASSTIEAVSIDTENSEAVTTIYSSVSDGIGDYTPSIAAKSGKIIIAWYSNSQNNIFGDTGVDSIYSVSIADGITSAITRNEISEGNVVSIEAGYLDEKEIVAYAIDLDGNFNTAEDRELYVSTNGAVGVNISNDTTADSAPQFATINGVNTLFWYSNGNIKYTSDFSAPAKKVAITAINKLADNFSFITKEDQTKIVWGATLDKENETDPTQYAIYAVNLNGTTWSAPYILTTVEEKIESTPTGYINTDGNVVVSYASSSAEVYSLTLKTVPFVQDTYLEAVVYNYADAVAGEVLPIQATIVNTGNMPVNKVTITLPDVNGETTSIEKTVSLDVGEAKIIEINEFIVPQNIVGETEYDITIACQTEDMTDNQNTIKIGYVDLEVKEIGRFYSNGTEYLKLQVENKSGIPAKNVILNVVADEKTGAIIYESNLGTVNGKSMVTRVVNVNILNNSEIAYAKLGTSSVDAVTENNELLLCFTNRGINFSGQYSLVVVAEEGGQITNNVNGNYEPGSSVSVSVAVEEGYQFKGWKSEDIALSNSLNKTQVIAMPSNKVVLAAVFEKIEQPIAPIEIPAAVPILSPVTAPVATPVPAATTTLAKKALKKGKKTTYKNVIYTVVKVAKNKSTAGEVTVANNSKNKKMSGTITIPTSFKVNGYTYKVTSISTKAFYKNTKIKKVVLSANIRKINAYAFAGCTKVITIQFKGRKVPSMSKTAFKGISKKAVFKVEKQSLKSYQKSLKKLTIAKGYKVTK